MVEFLPRAFFGNFSRVYARVIFVGAAWCVWFHLILTVLCRFIRSTEGEKTVSTQTLASSARAWFPPQDADPGRTQRVERAPRQGTRPPDCRRKTRQSVSRALGFSERTSMGRAALRQRVRMRM